LLESDDGVRADAFRQFHERGVHEPLLDALTDLEADHVMRGWLVSIFVCGSTSETITGCNFGYSLGTSDAIRLGWTI